MKNKAFTLAELMVVVIIIGIVAAFAIPNLRRSVERAHAREAINNLIAIHAASHGFRSENGTFWPDTSASNNLIAINTNLNLNIIANQMTYACTSPTNDGLTFSCTADFTGGGAWGLIVNEGPVVPGGGNPSCAYGGCAY
ncbi:MAG: type II secretion system protein [Candidatus Omnitrophota bacterium]